MLSFTGASGQTFTLGVKGGMAHRSLWAERENLEQTAGIAGVSVGVRLWRNLGLQSEALLVPQKLRGDGGFGAWTVDESYLQVPVLARASFPLPGTRVLPSAYAGPWIAYRTSCRYWDRFATDPSCLAGDVVDDRQWGLAWGGTIEVPAGPANLVLDLRGEAARSELVAPHYAYDRSFKYNGYTAFAGIALPLGARRYSAPLAPLKTRPASAPPGVREPLAAGDRIRAELLTASVHGTVLAIFPDSLIVQTRDAGFPERATLSSAMVRRVDVSLGRRSPVTPTFIGGAAGGAIALLYLAVHHAADDTGPPSRAQPYFVAAPFLGAIVGYLTGHERWRKAAFPAERADP